MRVLITGSEGFVGTEMQRQLRQDDNNYLFTNDLKPKTPMTSGYHSHYTGDCRDLFKKYRDIKFDLVIHLAAIVGGRMTIDNHPLSVADDLSIDSEMFQWAVATGQPRVVYYSSSAAYPINMQTSEVSRLYRNVGKSLSPGFLFLREVDINLDDISQPDMTYGWAKLTGEYLAKFAEAEGVRTHIFRPFSGYGELQALDYPFPSFIERAQRKDDPFVIWGDGNAYRDFIHIEDIVAATLEAVRQDVDGPTNLATGRPTNFNELAKMVTSAAGYSPEYHHIVDNPVGVQFRVGSPEKMSRFYTPKISLEEGIARSLTYKG